MVVFPVALVSKTCCIVTPLDSSAISDLFKSKTASRILIRNSWCTVKAIFPRYKYIRDSEWMYPREVQKSKTLSNN